MLRKLSFFKYHGTGNDFVLIDCISSPCSISENHKVFLAQSICDRHFGIGSDGIIFLERHHSVDFHMDFLNPDGSRSFCGNGSRCAVKCYIDQIQHQEELNFQAIDGIHKATLVQDTIAVSMTLVNAPVYRGKDLVIDTGSPHYLRFYEKDPGEDFLRIAQETRYSDEFKEEGINFNILIPSEEWLYMRTYERGVEDETLSCGTGVTAAALACSKHLQWPSPIKVKTKGGQLSVSFDQKNGHYSNIQLIGPATYVFKGEYDWGE